MKKSSLFILFFSMLILISVSALSQENTDGGSAPASADSSAEPDKPAATPPAEFSKEDSETANTEPVYESDDINALKGKPRAYKDEYNNYINDRVRVQLDNIDNVMGDSVIYKIGDGKEEKYSEPFTVKDEGPHVIYYYSVDKMGNREMQKNINFIVDNTPPSVIVTISAPFVKTNGVIYASENFTYTYSIDASDNAAGVASTYFAYEGKAKEEYSAPFTVKSKSPVKLEIFSEDKVGNVTKKFAVKIIDAGGNLIAESAEAINIVVDSTAPEVSIKPDPELFVKENGETIASKSHKYTIAAADSESGVSSVSYKLDGAKDYSPYTGEISFETNGKHKIEAVAKDAVGNTGAPAVLEVFVDIIPAKTSVKFVTE